MSFADRTFDELWVCPLGTVSYRNALAIQQDIAARRRAGSLPDTLLLLEHPPVYTYGRRTDPGELVLGEGLHRMRGIEAIPTDRGGRVTYHGPGQLVGYPIMGVSDVVAHLRTIEDAIVAAIAKEGIRARARSQDGPDYTGVWVGERKIASLGVHVSRGVSTHGFAVNVNNDLEPFSWVVACGLPDVAMTSVAAESGDGASLEHFRAHMVASFCQTHRRHQRLVSLRELGIEASAIQASAPGGRPSACAPAAALAHTDDPKIRAMAPA
jgi:lipoyl(octanoyl) transferase